MHHFRYFIAQFIKMLQQRSLYKVIECILPFVKLRIGFSIPRSVGLSALQILQKNYKTFFDQAYNCLIHFGGSFGAAWGQLDGRQPPTEYDL